MNSKKLLLGITLIVIFLFSLYSWNRVENSALLTDNKTIELLQYENDSLTVHSINSIINVDEKKYWHKNNVIRI